MCGISVLIRSPRASLSERTLLEMVRLSRHRGPDGVGVLYHGPGGATVDGTPEPTWKVGFGHARLAIIDLSTAARQPMQYGESLWLTYNGEVYNYRELRVELESLGQKFRTQSDSEVILAAYAAWGTEAFRRFRGMWALAILDAAKQQVVFSRDRLGIKPLYLVTTSNGLAAASEIKQFKALPGFQFHANDRSVCEYLQTGYEYPAETMFQDVVPLLPGSWLSIEIPNLKSTGPVSFWHPHQIASVCTDPHEAAVTLRASFREAIGLHLRSDVPVGVALSGGLDSSAIACTIVQDFGPSDVQTFTCAFPGFERDERRFAELARTGLTGRANFITPTAAGFKEDLKAFTWAHDEPVGGLSVYAAFHLAQAERAAKVPVTLSGQGSDEALGGYREAYWNYLKNLIREGNSLEALGHLGGALLPGGNRDLWSEMPGLALRLWNRGKTMIEFNRPSTEAPSRRRMLSESLRISSSNWRLYEMQQLFLPRLLKWEDRNSMAWGVEGRYPFLDHVFLETILSMHPRTSYSRGWTKNTLRLAMKGVLPEAIRMRRDKNGFEVPSIHWLDHELRPMLEGWLCQARPLWDYVDRNSVRRLAAKFWSHGRYGRGTLAQALFRVFACDQWLEAFDVRW